MDLRLYHRAAQVRLGCGPAIGRHLACRQIHPAFARMLARVVFDMFGAHPDKVALIFSEGGLSICMLKGTQGHTLMTLPSMRRLVERVDAPFAVGCRRGRFKGIDAVAASEAFFGIIEGTILGWLLSSSPASQYTSASVRQMLNVTRKMLLGLTAD